MQPSSRPWTAHLDLFGNPECHYHADVIIGSTVMKLILDTGSANTAVISDLCNDKNNCSFVEKPYLPVSPQTELLYSVNASYGNARFRSSWRGFATRQVVSFDGVQQAFSRVDIITENQHFFHPRCSKNQGIWGLAYSTLQTRPRQLENSNNIDSTVAEQHKLTLFDAIRKEKGLANAFTVQLCSKSAVEPEFSREFEFLQYHTADKLNATLPEQCSRDGHLWLGGYPSQSVDGDIIWTPLHHNRYYQVNINGFLINGEFVGGMTKLNTPRTVIDTGTKDIILSDENLQHLLHALWNSKLVQFDAVVSKEHEKLFWLDQAQLTLPKSALTIARNMSLAIAFENNQQISIPIENIIKIKSLNQDWVNISWTGFSSTSDDSMASTILGNSFLRGKTVIFDRGSSDELNSNGRIGFATASACCSAQYNVDTILPVHSSDRSKTALIIIIIVSVTASLLTIAVLVIREKRKKMPESPKYEKGFDETKITKLLK